MRKPKRKSEEEWACGGDLPCSGHAVNADGRWKADGAPSDFPNQHHDEAVLHTDACTDCSVCEEPYLGHICHTLANIPDMWGVGGGA